jgi:H+/gluconate symporter-like permease
MEGIVGIIGVLAALALLIYLALRGWNILLISLICAAIVALTNRLSLVDAIMGPYMQGLAGFVQQFFLLFLFGAIFGRIMGDSGAATSVAAMLSRRLGVRHAVLIAVLASAILSYGGVNIFILVFTVYPLGLALVRHANLPKRLLAGAIALGGGTFTMTALPGTPSVQNLIPTAALHTTATAAPWIGIAAAVVMAALGYWYLAAQTAKARRTGEGFAGGHEDAAPSAEIEEQKLPHWTVSLAPLAVVVGIVIYTSTHKLEPPLAWVSAALAVGSLVGVVLFHKHLKGLAATLGAGAANSALPILNTSAVIGFGITVSTVPAFKDFAQLVSSIHLPPLASASLLVNVMAGFTGSASGGLRIFMQTMAPHYIDLGVAPALLHRISTIASGGLDSLPHSGAVITLLTVMGLTHRQAYKDIFWLTVIVPLVALAVALALAALGLR